MPESSSVVVRIIFWEEVGCWVWLWKRRKSYSCSEGSTFWFLVEELADGLGGGVVVLDVLGVSDSDSESGSAPDPIFISTSAISSPEFLFRLLFVFLPCSFPVSSFPSFLSFTEPTGSECSCTGVSNSTGPRRAASLACSKAVRASSSLRASFCEALFFAGEEGEEERERLRSARRILLDGRDVSFWVVLRH